MNVVFLPIKVFTPRDVGLLSDAPVRAKEAARVVSGARHGGTFREWTYFFLLS